MRRRAARARPAAPGAVRADAGRAARRPAPPHLPAPHARKRQSSASPVCTQLARETRSLVCYFPKLGDAQIRLHAPHSSCYTSGTCTTIHKGADNARRQCPMRPATRGRDRLREAGEQAPAFTETGLVRSPRRAGRAPRVGSSRGEPRDDLERRMTELATTPQAKARAQGVHRRRHAHARPARRSRSASSAAPAPVPARRATSWTTVRARSSAPSAPA